MYYNTFFLLFLILFPLSQPASLYFVLGLNANSTTLGTSGSQNEMTEANNQTLYWESLSSSQGKDNL